MNASTEPMRWRAFLLVLAVLAPSALWVALDRSVWPWDPAWYGQTATDLYLTLTQHPEQWPKAMVRTLEVKAPAICWLGQLLVPLHVILGSVNTALLSLVLGATSGAALLLFLGMRLVGAGRGALLAGLAMASSPLLVGLSHRFFVEPLQLLVVCWLIHLATRRPPRLASLLELTTATTLGLLAKTSTPAYILMPAAMVLLQAMRRRPIEPTELPRLPRRRLVACVLASGSCIAWYATNWKAVSAFVVSASSGEISKLYGHAGTFGEKLAFWLEQGGRAAFAVPVAGLVWAGLVLLAAGRRLIRRGRPDRFDVLALLSAAQIAICLTVFARQVNEETRYLLPLLPYVAVLTAFVAREAGKVITLLLFVAFAAQFVVVHACSLRLVDPLATTSPWLQPYEHDDHAARRMEALIELTDTPASANTYTIIGIETPSFNANSASHRAAVHQVHQGTPYRHFYTSLGWAEQDQERAWKRIVDIHPVYVAFLHGVNTAGDPENAVTEAIHARIRTSDRYESVALPGFPEVLLYRSRIPR